MDSKTTEFLQYYSKIENALEDMKGVSRKSSFAQMVREAAKYNYIIRREQELLDSLRELRNVLVHEAGNLIIAVPSDEALKAIRRIYFSLEKPVKVYEVIDHHLVTMDSFNNLAEGLRLMKEHDYSQIPIYNGGAFWGLLTSEAITKWLMANMDKSDDILRSMDNVPMGEVIPFCEQPEDVGFISRNTLVETLLSRMMEHPAKSGVYFITHSGKASEKPLGIVTASDYPLLEESLEGKP